MLSRRPALSLALALTVLAVLAGGCSDGGPAVETLALVRNANPAVPMAAVLTVETDRETRVGVEIRDDWGLVSSHAFEGLARSHEVPVVGFRPDREHDVRVTVTDRAGRSTEALPLGFRTEPLPSSLPPIEIRMRRRARSEPGVTFLPLQRGTPGGPDRTYGLAVAVDGEGQVVWFYEVDHTVTYLRATPDGTLIYLSGGHGVMVEIDLLGNVLRRWHTTGIAKPDVPPKSIPIDTDSLHHDLQYMPNGNFLAISSEVRHFDSFPERSPDPDPERAPARLVGDVLVEFTPAGEVVRRWSLFDLLDPHRFSPGSHNTAFWQLAYGAPGPMDFAHTNSVDYDPRDDTLVVSSNNQCAVFEMVWSTGEVRWILGRPERWEPPWAEKLLEPVGELEWPSNQHAAVRVPNGNVVLFDNGRHRTPTFEDPGPEEEKYSRVVEFAVDPDAGTVRQAWSYGSPDGDHFYSEQLCDVDRLPGTGNYLVTDGARVRWVPVPEAVKQKLLEAGRTVPEALPHTWVHVFEVTRDAEVPEKVFELVVDQPEALWTCYRAERFPSVYARAELPLTE